MTNSNNSDENYQLATEVWKTFKMKTMREYMVTYCMCDTLILAEVFEMFRMESIVNFGMDPTHFISLPGFAFEEFLKKQTSS